MHWIIFSRAKARGHWMLLFIELKVRCLFKSEFEVANCGRIPSLWGFWNIVGHLVPPQLGSPHCKPCAAHFQPCMSRNLWEETSRDTAVHEFVIQPGSWECLTFQFRNAALKQQIQKLYIDWVKVQSLLCYKCDRERHSKQCQRLFKSRMSKQRPVRL